jgi:hypothetical protein
MKSLTKFHPDPIRICFFFLLAAAALTIAACATAPKTATVSPGAPQMMFVQSADDIRVDPAAGTFRLVKVNQQTIYFSDRPQRMAGHFKMADYLNEWTARAGKNNFGADPPNATLSVYEPGQPDNTLVVVKITNPVVEGEDLIYRYKVIDGRMPANGGATTLFIDWIGYRGYGTVYRRPVYIR